MTVMMPLDELLRRQRMVVDLRIGACDRVMEIVISDPITPSAVSERVREMIEWRGIKAALAREDRRLTRKVRKTLGLAP